MNNSVGMLKTKTTVYCEICGCRYRRQANINVYSNDPYEIEKAKEKLTKKVQSKYTCRICKTIKKEAKSLI
jgi:ribosomal protein L44E